MTDERIITSDACVSEGAAALVSRHPQFARVLPLVAPLPLRLRDDGFEQLLSAIVSQQISTAAAAAVWAKLQSARLTAPESVLRASEADLREAGLSRQKARYAKALADARIDYPALRGAPSETVVQTLTEVPGIGRWTAEIYAMFSLGRADVFAPGDLALQHAAQALFQLPARPSEGQLRRMSQDWSPWRSVAARILWAYYRHIKGRDGIR